MATRRAFLASMGISATSLALASCKAADSTTDAPGAAALGGGAVSTAPSGTAIASKADLRSPAPAMADMQPSGLLWTGARIVMCTVPVDASAVGKWLPPGLRAATPAMSTFFVANYPMTMFGSAYNEAAVLLHVEDEKGPAWHCPWIVVDDDTALVFGREMLGFPKKLAEIRLDEGSGVVGTAARKGTEVLRIDAGTKPFTDASGPLWSKRIVNVHGSFVGGMRLLEIKTLTEKVHERKTGRATVTLGTTARDALGPLVPSPVEGDAIFAVADFGELANGGLPAGEPFPADWAWSRQISTAL